MPVDRLDFPSMSCQRRLFCARRKVPDLQCGVVGARDKLGVCGGDCEPAHSLGVCLYLLDVVEVGLPVLDHSRLVGGQQPVVGRRVLDGANGGFMGLHDGFKVEAHAVPQRELTARGASEQAAAFWRPFDHVDGMLDLVEGRVDGLCRDGLGGAGDSRCGGLQVDDVAGAGPLYLWPGDVFVARTAGAHPLHRGGAIVGDGAWGMGQQECQPAGL